MGVFESHPDPRNGQNTQYALADICMSAFSMFFMHHPSFLAFQCSLHENTGRDNTLTLFGMTKIPTANHIRPVLDGMDPGALEQVYFYIVDSLAMLTPGAVHNIHGGYTLIALAGSEYFCSKNVNCETSSHRMRSDGKEEYFHTFIVASIVTLANRRALSLPPECVRPYDGASKQDCELKTVSRWLERVAPLCTKYNPIYLGR